MANRFLTPSSGVNVSDGSTVLFGQTIGAINLDASMPVKTNAQNNLVSTNLETSDINGLDTSLGDKLPLSGGTMTGDINMGANDITNAVTVGTNELDINGLTLGTAKIQAPLSFTSYTLTLPPNDGDNGDVLHTDGAGVMTWQTGVDATKLPLAGGTMSGDINMSDNDITDIKTLAVNFGTSGVCTINGGLEAKGTPFDIYLPNGLPPLGSGNVLTLTNIGELEVSPSVLIDTINEKTTDNGVDIDGVLLKDATALLSYSGTESNTVLEVNNTATKSFKVFGNCQAVSDFGSSKLIGFYDTGRPSLILNSGGAGNYSELRIENFPDANPDQRGARFEFVGNSVGFLLIPGTTVKQMIPCLDATIDFGSATKQWKDGRFSGVLNAGSAIFTGAVGTDNLLIGCSSPAGANLATGSDNNVFIGCNAAVTATNDANSNVCIGNNSDVANTFQQIAIGSDAKTTASYGVAIGRSAQAGQNSTALGNGCVAGTREFVFGNSITDASCPTVFKAGRNGICSLGASGTKFVDGWFNGTVNTGGLALTSGVTMSGATNTAGTDQINFSNSSGPRCIVFVQNTNDNFQFIGLGASPNCLNLHTGSAVDKVCFKHGTGASSESTDLEVGSGELKTYLPITASANNTHDIGASGTAFRDGWFSGNVSCSDIIMNGDTLGSITINTPASVTSHILILPSAQGGANTSLQNDGSGNLSWVATGDTVSSATSGDNQICRYNGSNNKTIQASGITIDDSDVIAGLVAIDVSGNFRIESSTQVDIKAGNSSGVLVTTTETKLVDHDLNANSKNINNVGTLTVDTDFKYGQGNFEFYYDTESTTTITVANTWYAVNLTGLTTSHSIGFTVDGTTTVGEVKYTGTRDRYVHCGVTISVRLASGGNDQLAFAIFDTTSNTIGSGATMVPGSEVDLFVSNNANESQSTAIHFFPRLSQNDKFQLACKNVGATDNIIMKHINCFGIASPAVPP